MFQKNTLPPTLISSSLWEPQNSLSTFSVSLSLHVFKPQHNTDLAATTRCHKCAQCSPTMYLNKWSHTPLSSFKYWSDWWMMFESLKFSERTHIWVWIIQPYCKSHSHHGCWLIQVVQEWPSICMAILQQIWGTVTTRVERIWCQHYNI